MQQVEAEEGALRLKLSPLVDRECVVNLARGTHHKVLVASASDLPSTWRTSCGWRFGDRQHQFVVGLPSETA